MSKKDQSFWKWKQLALGFELGVGNLSSRGYDVTHVPVRVRDIPRHPGDYWVGSTPYLDAPIITDSAPDTIGNDPSWNGLIYLRTGWFDVGYGHSLNSDTGHVRVSQNQYGDSQRGTGMTLRYYEMRLKESRMGYLRCGVVVPISWRDWNGHGLTIGAGFMMGLDPRVFVAEQGYDRWDHDQKYRTVEFAKIRNDPVPYLRLGYTHRLNEKRMQIGAYVQYRIGDSHITPKPGFDDTIIKGSADRLVSVGLTFQRGIK